MAGYGIPGYQNYANPYPGFGMNQQPVVNNYNYGTPSNGSNGGPTVPAGSGEFDPLGLAIQTGGAFLANQQQQQGMNGAIGMAGYNGSNVTGPGGMGINYSNSGYNLTGPTSGPMAQFGNLASNGINFAANNVGSNPYDTAAGSTLSAFQNFDPNAFANNEYNQLTAAAAPGMTDQTQKMLNYEQASGRGGLNQNGQLGDLGGLALAQQTADTQRRLASIQDARTQGGYLAGLSTTFQNQANTDRTSAMNNGSNALAGELGINSQLQNFLNSSIAASSARAQAGANQGGFRFAGGMNQGNNYGNYFGSLGQVVNQNGGLANLGKQAWNAVTGGGDNGGWTDQQMNDWADLNNNGGNNPYVMGNANDVQISDPTAGDVPPP